jgi:hypothetical protein
MMTTRADTFVFRLTSLCDKKCVLCCNNYDEIRKNRMASFGDLLARFSEIRDYHLTATGGGDEGGPYVILTGGEALLYKSSRAGAAVTLFDVVAAVRCAVPGARVIVKSGGFRTGATFQRALFERISKAFPFPVLEFRLGWNLYQDDDSEERAVDRFTCTVLRVLEHQPFVSIDTIYDKTNLRTTCRTLEEGLRRLGIGVEGELLLPLILRDANEHRRITIRTAREAIILDLGPSYPPNQAAAARDYYSEPSSECDLIENGTSCLYYDTDLSLIHCNDSFVDARVPSLAIGERPIADQLSFVNERFARLNSHLSHAWGRFKSRQERCFFCTRFVMADSAETPGAWPQ